jgi:hypothetical protein
MTILSQKVVYSFTTIPTRLKYVKPVLFSILNQTLLPDKIYLVIPKKTRKRLSYSLKKLNELQHKISLHPNGNRVIFTRPNIDYGPIMKIKTVLELETDPDTIVIIGDDDRILKSHTIQTFVNRLNTYNNCAISLSGWNYGHFPCYFQFVHDLKQDIQVDWIQGNDCIAFKRGLFEKNLNIVDYSSMSSELSQIFTMNDDHWIAYHFHKRRVPLIVLGLNINEYITPTKHSDIDAICQRTEFINEVIKISRYLASQNLYTHNTSKPSSLGLNFFLIFGCLLMLYIYRYDSKRYLPLFIIVFLVYRLSFIICKT